MPAAAKTSHVSMPKIVSGSPKGPVPVVGAVVVVVVVVSVVVSVVVVVVVVLGIDTVMFSTLLHAPETPKLSTARTRK